MNYYPTARSLVLLISALFLTTACSETENHAFLTNLDLLPFNETAAKGCDPYSQSQIYRPRSNTIITSPRQDWTRQIEEAGPDTEILLQDGSYFLQQYAIRVRDGVTIRSASGQREHVQIIGQGYDVEAEGFMITGNDVTIADLSVSNMRDHAVAVKPRWGGRHSLQLYNLNLYDIGTQHIKVNPGGAIGGLVACSEIGYSPGGAVGDYNGAIDLHGTSDWIISDNTIYNITGDGSGCRIDQDCGIYTSAPAILAWNNANGTKVLRNDIIDSYRNIAFGFGTSHSGGVISDNVIRQSQPGDAGIALFGASGTLVENNLVRLVGSYPGAIEYRASNNLSILDNRLTSRPWNRGGNANIDLAGNTP